MSRILCLCLLAVALLVRLPGPSTAATTYVTYLPLIGTTPHSGNYLHISNRGIFLGNRARTTRTPLLQNTAAGSYSNPAWSPDGRRVSAVYRQGAATALVAIDIRSSAVVTLTDSRLPGNPSIDTMTATPVWSADGRWIAVPATDGVYRVSPLGGAPLRLTDQRGTLSWSPTGAVLVVSNSNGHFLINPDAVTAVRLLIQGGTLSWGPRSTRLAISGPDGTSLLNSSTGAVRRLIAGDGTLTWSPDSATLAISSAGGSYLANAATGVLTQVAAGRAWFSWSLDSRYVVFDRGGLVRVRADGSERTQLTSFGTMQAWSPNGQLIAFVDSSAPGVIPPFERMHLLDLRTLQTEQIDTTSNLFVYPRWSPSSRWLVYGWYQDQIKGGRGMRALDVEDRQQIGSCGSVGDWDRAVPVLSVVCTSLSGSGALTTWDYYYDGDMREILSVYNDGVSGDVWVQWAPA